MLHIATVHYKDPSWIDIQLGEISRHVSADCMTWAAMEGLPEYHYEKFDVVYELRGPHPGKLNYLAARICEAASPTDVIMFLDGDAFPVADPVPLYRRALSEHDLLAVQRLENLGDVQPHPCFALTHVKTWRDLHGDWSSGYTWRNSRGQAVTDVGGNLLAALKERGQTWEPLNRSNRKNVHPLWFAVYGDVVYHHGAGFRDPISRLDKRGGALGRQWARADLVRKGLLQLTGPARARWKVQGARRLSAQVYANIYADPSSIWDLFY